MLDRGGVALKCAGCGLPIPYDHSGKPSDRHALKRCGPGAARAACPARPAETARDMLRTARELPLQNGRKTT